MSTMPLLRSSTVLMLAPLFLLFSAAGCTLALQLDECQSDEDCEEAHGPAWQCTDGNLCEFSPADCETDEDCHDAHDVTWSCADDNQCWPPQQGTECTSDDDCHSFHGLSWSCSPQEGYCERDFYPCDVGLSGTGQCPDGQECGQHGWCQPSDSTLLSEPCDQSYGGPIEDDDTFIIGLLLPLSGDEAGFGLPLFDAVSMALEQFNDVTVGGIDDRPVAVLACDTQGRNDLALEGAEHLRDVGVEAVVGPDYSDQTLEVASEVTIDAGMTLVSPSATAAAISHLDDDGLVWRTTASDAIQGQALGHLVEYLLEYRPQYADLDDDSIPEESTAAILQRANDPYAEGLWEAIIHDVVGDAPFGDGNFQYIYPGEPPEEETETFDDLVAEVIDDTVDDGLGPDVIVILGSAESWQIAELLESSLEEEADNPPVFVFADAARNADAAGDAPDSLFGRVWGTAPRSAPESDYEPFDRFRTAYQRDFGADPADFAFVPHAFDAMYVIALGAAYGGFDGHGISEGMTYLNDGERYFFNNLQEAVDELTSGNSINFDGASGPLNFDEHGDPVGMPTALWCFEGDNGERSLPEQGSIYDSDEQFIPRTCLPECDSDDECTAAPDDNYDSSCERGFCLYECDEEEFGLCDEACVDHSENPDHCGNCDISCHEEITIPDNAQPVCDDGDCDFVCDDNYERCGDECVDTSSDPQFCGDCDTSCHEEITIPDNAYPVCEADTCDFQCNEDEGYKQCEPDECIDTNSSIDHCGNCDNDCNSGKICQEGTCIDDPDNDDNGTED